jgi:hypothetical protein
VIVIGVLVIAVLTKFAQGNGSISCSACGSRIALGPEFRGSDHSAMGSRRRGTDRGRTDAPEVKAHASDTGGFRPGP